MRAASRWGFVLVLLLACSTKAKKPVAGANPEGGDAAMDVNVLRSAPVPPRCPASTPAAAQVGDAAAEVALTGRAEACRGPSPADVCACLGKDLGILDAGLDRGPGSCELDKMAGPSVQVATVFSSAEREGIVSAIATVLIVRDGAGWAARGVGTAVAEIDLSETPEMSANLAVTAVSEATYGGVPFAWIQTSATEEDVAGDERYIDETTTLTICELGTPVRCGQVDLASWAYVAARNGGADDDSEVEPVPGALEGCRSAKGAALLAEQRDANGVTLKQVVGARDGQPPRYLPFVRR